MIVAIIGSRTITGPGGFVLVTEAVKKSRFDIDMIVSGDVPGVDSLARIYAAHHDIEFKEFPANWELYGRRAGYLRNLDMAEYSDATIAIWDGVSKGTQNMITITKDKGNQLYTLRYDRRANHRKRSRHSKSIR